MPPGPGCNCNQSVSALADRGIGMAVVDNVMQHNATIGNGWQN